MRKLFNLLFAIALTTSIWAQAPQKMSYQAVIRNSSNALVVSGKVGMRISILQGSVTGTSVYSETQTPTTNANGLVNIEIGDSTIQSGDFAIIDWANGSYFIKTEIDPAGGTNYTITGTSQLLSVPYAFHAKTAGTVIGAVTETQNLVDVLAQSNSAGNKNITNLADPVSTQDAATKAYVDGIINKLSETGVIVVDIDGTLYKTIRIGSQVWMAQNLRTTKYKNGTAIPLITDNTAWSTLNTPGYCWSNNDSASYSNTYGALYNWYTVNTGNLCPTGWHVPTDAEWSTLTNYLGGESIPGRADVAGGKLKETGTTHWNTPNEGATNETGFTALPGGIRHDNGTFSSIGSFGGWWSATDDFDDNARGWCRGMYSSYPIVMSSRTLKLTGSSVRCVRD
jgi:uncharacterized protein (TIGR02145 family)